MGRGSERREGRVRSPQSTVLSQSVNLADKTGTFYPIFTSRYEGAIKDVYECSYVNAIIPSHCTASTSSVSYSSSHLATAAVNIAVMTQ